MRMSIITGMILIGVIGLCSSCVSTNVNKQPISLPLSLSDTVYLAKHPLRYSVTETSEHFTFRFTSNDRMVMAKIFLVGFNLHFQSGRRSYLINYPLGILELRNFTSGYTLSSFWEESGTIPNWKARLTRYKSIALVKEGSVKLYRNIHDKTAHPEITNNSSLEVFNSSVKIRKSALSRFVDLDNVKISISTGHIDLPPAFRYRYNPLTQQYVPVMIPGRQLALENPWHADLVTVKKDVAVIH